MCRSCWKRWKNNGIVRKPLRFGYPFCKRGNAPCPRRGAKRKGHLRFPFLFELLPFPLLHSLTQTRERRPLRNKGNGRGFFLCYGRTTFGVHPLEQPVRSVGYRTATQAVSSPQARHSSAARFVSLEVTDSTYESIYLVAFILADAVRYNVPRICAALLCRALR